MIPSQQWDVTPCEGVWHVLTTYRILSIAATKMDETDPMKTTWCGTATMTHKKKTIHNVFV